MTRSFDVFDRDDFRSPDDLDRGSSGDSESFWSARVRLSELHRKEERADAHDRGALIVPAESIRRFVVRSASEKFWNEFAPFSGIEIRLTNSETPKSSCFRR